MYASRSAPNARDIRRLIVVNGLWLAVTGIAIGMEGAYALGRFTSNLLYEIQPGDPATYAGLVLVLLTATTVLASWIPARRAQRVDPASVLRQRVNADWYAGSSVCGIRILVPHPASRRRYHRRMQYRVFGRTKWRVSEIGYGMWGMAGWTGSDDEESRQSLDRAVDAGLQLLRHGMGLWRRPQRDSCSASC